MKRILASLIVAVASAASPETHTLRLIVEGGYEADRSILFIAKSTAAEILRGALRIEWSKDDRAFECAEQVILVRLSMQTPPTQFPQALGFTVPSAPGRRTVTAFLDRVLARKGNVKASGAILGHVIAHELIHSLQNVPRHSADGLMKARWSEGDLQQMPVKPFHLTPEDANGIENPAARCSILAERQTR